MFKVHFLIKPLLREQVWFAAQISEHSGRERCAMASSDDSSEEATFDEQMASIDFAELLANLERMPGVSQTSELEASETGE